jgi:hypothetical protein
VRELDSPHRLDQLAVDGNDSDRARLASPARSSAPTLEHLWPA